MRKQVVVAVTLLAAAVGCSPPAERCGQEICTKEQRCSSEMKCVTDGKPIISLEKPLAMAMVSTDKVEVQGVAQDDDKPPTVELSSDQVIWVPVKLDADGGFALNLPIQKVDGSQITITARARDSKMQEAKATRTLNVDNTAPLCSFVTPVSGGTTNSTGSLMLSMRASDGSLQLVNPRVSTDGAMTFATPPGDMGNYDVGWALPMENGGSHDLVFRVDDPSGNTCEVRSTILVDNVKPTVSFTMPAPGGLLGVPFFTAGGKVGGAASDGARLLKSVTLDFADLGGPRPATIVGNTWSVSVPTPVGDDFKTHVATVVATDLADNTATAMLTVIVDVKPPALTITSPTPAAKLNISNFPAGNNAPLTWTLTDGDPQLVLGLVQTDGGFVVPPVVPTSSTDNPKTYSPLLRANDRAGNISTATVTFTVDRVAPTVTASTPANNTRMWPGIVTADFSEPMTFGIGLALNPNVIGSWTTPSHFEVTGLAKDSVYSVTTGMTVTDLHGNQVIPINYRFHTDTVVPAGGALLGTNYEEVADAVADSEGTLNVLAYVLNNGNIDWIQFDSKTGLASILQTFTSGNSVGNLVASRTILPDLSSKRFAGLWWFNGTNNVRYNINGGAVTTIAGAQAFVPTAPFPGEGTGLAEFGTIAGGAYKRTGRADVAIGLADVDRFTVSDTRWEAVRHVNGGTESASFGCGGSGCAATAVKTLGGGAVGTPNSASSKLCSIHGYLNGANEMTTIFRYQPGCGGSMNPCAADINEANNFDQVTADPAADGTFYGFNTVSAGVYQIKKRVLANGNCAGAITNVGAPITLGVVLGQPRIVVIHGVVGLVYADSGHLLKFVSP